MLIVNFVWMIGLLDVIDGVESKLNSVTNLLIGLQLPRILLLNLKLIPMLKLKLVRIVLNPKYLQLRLRQILH